MELLHNMSAPPRSEVRFNIAPLGEYLIFDPCVLATKLSKRKMHSTKSAANYLSKHLKKHVLTHPYIINYKNRPKGYMLASTFDNTIKCSGTICRDVNLLIHVFCSTVNDIYIPNKEFNYSVARFDKVLYFMKEEIII